ncbi:hypothetical protein XELAEV_18025934mg [Xenopus laevis]|uniref:Uncharacterized protein n=1 Tax=Xenopus laevis TaxID=8355 RepID=A0A974D1Q5_XENLA|nr:hypothetical protein XELAEV_18025934mg [Xenopus laevis]
MVQVRRSGRSQAAPPLVNTLECQLNSWSLEKILFGRHLTSSALIESFTRTPLVVTMEFSTQSTLMTDFQVRRLQKVWDYLIRNPIHSTPPPIHDSRSQRYSENVQCISSTNC